MSLFITLLVSLCSHLSVNHMPRPPTLKFHQAHLHYSCQSSLQSFQTMLVIPPGVLHHRFQKHPGSVPGLSVLCQTEYISSLFLMPEQHCYCMHLVISQSETTCAVPGWCFTPYNLHKRSHLTE